jgi:aryl-alcohol dehydrogenase-like predicted oxidoreductase
MKIILGTVQFGLNYGINNSVGKPKKEHVFQILSYAYEKGIRYLDTAEVYGNSHKLIGEFHKLNPSKKFKIITKFPHELNDSLDNKIKTYLNQLSVDRLHAILFHSFDSYIKHKEQLKIKSKLKIKKIEYIGVSIYTNDQMEEVINDINIDIIQMPFNLFDNINQRGELLKKAKIKNKIIHTRSAFLQGLFFMNKSNPHIIKCKLEKELEVITDISLKSSMSIGSIALNYCLVQPKIDSVLIGVESLQQLEQNISFTENKLRDIDINQINSIKIKNIEFLNPLTWLNF